MGANPDGSPSEGQRLIQQCLVRFSRCPLFGQRFSRSQGCDNRRSTRTMPRVRITFLLRQTVRCCRYRPPRANDLSKPTRPLTADKSPSGRGNNGRRTRRGRLRSVCRRGTRCRRTPRNRPCRLPEFTRRWIRCRWGTTTADLLRRGSSSSILGIRFGGYRSHRRRHRLLTAPEGWPVRALGVTLRRRAIRPVPLHTDVVATIMASCTARYCRRKSMQR